MLEINIISSIGNFVGGWENFTWWKNQGATKVLSDSPGLVEWLVGLGFSYRSLPDGQPPLVPHFDDKLSFYTKRVCTSSRKLQRENDNILWGQIIVA